MKFKKYGFVRKAFTELNCTGVKGESHKNIKYGYTKEIEVNEELTITFNIIPQNNEWICEKKTFNRKVFNEILDYEVKNEENEEFLKSHLSNFDYAMQKLNYKIEDYQKVNRWAYMDTKENALNEIIFQYEYLF